MKTKKNRTHEKNGGKIVKKKKVLKMKNNYKK